MAKAYLITNSSGNTSSVTKEIYEDLKGKEGYKAKVVESSKKDKPTSNEEASTDFNDLTVEQLKELADEKELEYSAKIKKAELIELIEGAE